MDLSNERLSSFCLISPPGRPSASADGFKHHRLTVREELELYSRELFKTRIDEDRIFTHGKIYNKSANKNRLKEDDTVMVFISKYERKKKLIQNKTHKSICLQSRALQ